MKAGAGHGRWTSVISMQVLSIFTSFTSKLLFSAFSLPIYIHLSSLKK